MTLQRLAIDMTPGQQHTVIFWCVVITVITLAGFGLIAYVKRYIKARANQAHYDTGFSLSDLRAMRDRGEITPEEYEQTRARVIAKVKGRAKHEEREKREAQDTKRQSHFDPVDGDASPDAGPADAPDSGTNTPGK